MAVGQFGWNKNIFSRFHGGAYHAPLQPPPEVRVGAQGLRPSQIDPLLAFSLREMNWGARGAKFSWLAWLLIPLGTAVGLWTIWLFAEIGRGTPTDTAAIP